jgi:hypothetical protein
MIAKSQVNLSVFEFYIQHVLQLSILFHDISRAFSSLLNLTALPFLEHSGLRLKVGTYDSGGVLAELFNLLGGGGGFLNLIDIYLSI